MVNIFRGQSSEGKNPNRIFSLEIFFLLYSLFPWIFSSFFIMNLHTSIISGIFNILWTFKGQTKFTEPNPVGISVSNRSEEIHEFF